MVSATKPTEALCEVAARDVQPKYRRYDRDHPNSAECGPDTSVFLHAASNDLRARVRI